MDLKEILKAVGDLPTEKLLLLLALAALGLAAYVVYVIALLAGLQ